MGFSLSELAQWDKQGRKPTTAESLNNVLTSVYQANQANKARQQQELAYEAEMRKAGYTQQPQSGGKLNKVLKQLMGTDQNYQFSGVPVTAKDKAAIAKDKATAEWYGRRDTGANKGMTASEYNAASKAAGDLYGQNVWGQDKKKTKELKKQISKQYLEQSGLYSTEDKIANGGFETKDEVVEYLVNEEGYSEEEARAWTDANVEE